MVCRWRRAVVLYATFSTASSWCALCTANSDQLRRWNRWQVIRSAETLQAIGVNQSSLHLYFRWLFLNDFDYLYSVNIKQSNVQTTIPWWASSTAAVNFLTDLVSAMGIAVVSSSSSSSSSQQLSRAHYKNKRALQNVKSKAVNKTKPVTWRYKQRLKKLSDVSEEWVI